MCYRRCFFLCLSLGGITSLLAMIELPVRTLQEMQVPRKYGLPVVLVVLFCFGLPSALDLNILVNQDFVWAFGQVLAGVVSISLPILYGVTKFREDLVNQFGLDDWKLPKIWDYIVNFLDPVIAVALLVSFVADTVSNDKSDWYKFKRESLMWCFVEWLFVLLLLLLLNFLWIFRRRTRGSIRRISRIRDS